VLRYEPTYPYADVLRDCLKFIHDEDCAIGLHVQNPAGESWECYGGRRALDKVAAENLKRAVQASADEIYAAYSTKIVPSPSTYAAWVIAPTLASARFTSQALAKLFTFDSERRRDIKKRQVWEFKADWWPWSTAFERKTSGYWIYPIVLGGVHGVIPWSCISAVSPAAWSRQVFYQMPGGAIARTARLDGRWICLDEPIVNAVSFTLLASISWVNGKEVSGTPHTRPDGYMGRLACTTLTANTFSKNTTTPKVGVGLQDNSAK